MSLRKTWHDALRWMMQTIARRLSHFVVPEIARLTEAELLSDAFDDQSSIPQTIRVEDKGADTTVVSFSNGGFMHGGLPTYAFRDLLSELQPPCNLIFIRDVHRVAYHLRPNGEPGGLAFYEAEIKATLARLGSSTTHMIGDSSGAAAAVYFGTRCDAERVLALTMPYPMEPWGTPRAVLRHVLNLREVLRDRGSYWDSLVISAFSLVARRTLISHIGEDNIFSPIETYQRAARRPKLTIIYGERCLGDAANAMRYAELSDVELMPLPTGRHNIWIPLARSGSIKRLVQDKLLGAVEPRYETTPQPGQ